MPTKTAKKPTATTLQTENPNPFIKITGNISISQAKHLVEAGSYTRTIVVYELGNYMILLELKNGMFSVISDSRGRTKYLKSLDSAAKSILSIGISSFYAQQIAS